MSRFMYDSVTAADIPRGALMVAGYVDGRYAWTEADWNLHAKARQVRITVGSGTLEADVADVENGDYSAAQGAAWAKRKIARDRYAGLYFSASRWPEIHAALVAEGVNLGLVQTWVAQWDQVPFLLPGQTAKQYSHPPESGGHYDVSVVVDYWSGVDPVPAPHPAPTPAPTPTPTPPPPPVPGPAVNEARVAFTALASALTTGLQALLGEIDQATQKLKDS